MKEFPDKNCAWICLMVVAIGIRTRPKASAFFSFGDSYADTGNSNHNSSAWHFPYGMGYPTGRFSDGYIQTDFLADVLGLDNPTNYADKDKESIATGLNFASDGSAVTYALGILPLGAQVDQFELVLRTGVYSPSVLADSVTLVSNHGNDYANPFTTLEYLKTVPEVVEGITLALKRLYELGLRNMLVSNLAPLNCAPNVAYQSNYDTCETYVRPLIEHHNGLLLKSVQKLNTLPDANFVILDETKALSYIINHFLELGFRENLEPCCKPSNPLGNCGDVDTSGEEGLYTLCLEPKRYVFWDTVHPTATTWSLVVDLYCHYPGFLIGATTLTDWLRQNSLRPTAAAPAPGPGVPQGGAIGQLDAGFEAMISEPDYAETLGLLQAFNLDGYLAGMPNQTITVFLPNNIAYSSIPASTFVFIYGEDEVLPVAQFHVVEGYYDSTQLSSSVQNLTTISGLDLQITPLENETVVGPVNATVVGSDLYKVEGQVVVHGINKILVPPRLQ